MTVSQPSSSTLLGLGEPAEDLPILDAPLGVLADGEGRGAVLGVPVTVVHSLETGYPKGHCMLLRCECFRGKIDHKSACSCLFRSTILQTR